MVIAQRLSNYQQQCLRYSSASLEGFVMREVVGRAVSMAAACLLHAEAVSRAVKICFWVIQEVFSHIDDPWLTIPWLEREKQELKKTYSDCLCSFADTICPPKQMRIEEPVNVRVIPPVSPIDAPFAAPPPSRILTPRLGARAPSPELDAVIVPFEDPEGQLRLASRGPTPIDAVIVPFQDSEGQLRLSSRGSTPVDAVIVTPRDPEGQISLQETKTVLQPPPYVPTDLIDVVLPISPIDFRTITIPTPARPPQPVLPLKAPPRVSTDPINVVKALKPITFPSIRKEEAWEEIAPPVVPLLALPAQPPSSTVLKTARSATPDSDWDRLSPEGNAQLPADCPALTGRSTATGGSTARLGADIANGEFHPVITTPQTPPQSSHRSNA